MTQGIKQEDQHIKTLHLCIIRYICWMPHLLSMSHASMFIHVFNKFYVIALTILMLTSLMSLEQFL